MTKVDHCVVGAVVSGTLGVTLLTGIPCGLITLAVCLGICGIIYAPW